MIVRRPLEMVKQDRQRLALDKAIECRPFDAECLSSLYEAILAKLDEIYGAISAEENT